MKNQIINLSLTLFGLVPQGKNQSTNFKKTLKYGILVTENATYALDLILAYFKKNKLSAEQLNATFHKSWEVIQNSSREELLLHQILHYLTTYGTNFTSDFIYFPTEKLEIPALTKLPIRVIRGVEPSLIIDKCLKMLSSGIALQEETIDNILDLLSALDYQFTSVEGIKNREAVIKIIAKSGVYPKSPVEFLRYLVYSAIETTLLIKNKETIEAIKTAQKDVSKDIDQFGLKKCATIFNRFKPLWLAFKTNAKNRPLINEINRLAKRHHQPMPIDVLNTVTSIVYKKLELYEV